ncbi:outer membrane beta-barrel protein [Mucilaginibacter oryzae]|nr:outer membrane beta-barrel protein [Mucilaginibacter oryzae]
MSLGLFSGTLLRLICVLFLFFFNQQAYAQESISQFHIKGFVYSSDKRQPLDGTSIKVKYAADSSTRISKTTNRKGEFEFLAPVAKEYFIQISFVGYKKKEIHISTSSNRSTYLLDTIFLTGETQLLKQVEVKGNRKKFRLKNDTLEFNSSSIYTDPDGTTKDILKKIPGLRLVGDDVILFNGQMLDRVLLDGKVYFNNDIKLLLKTIPAELIDKIQLSASNPGQKINTVNLTLKTRYKKSIFGKAGLGKGNKKTFDNLIDLSRFDDKEKMTFTGSWNNVSSLSTGPFLVDSKSLGFNYSSNISKNTELILTTGYERSSSNENGQVTRSFRLDSVAQTYQSDSQRKFKQGKLFGTLALNIALDSFSKLTIDQRFEYQSRDVISYQAFGTRLDQTNELKNNGVNNISNSYTGGAIQGRIGFDKSIKRNNQQLTISLTYYHFPSRVKDSVNYNTYFNQLQTADSIIRQLRSVDNNDRGIGLTANYSTDLRRNIGLSLSNSFRFDKSTISTSVVDFDRSSGVYDKFNPGLSNDFKSDFFNETLNFSLRLGIRKVNFIVGTALQQNAFSNRYSSIKNQRKLITINPFVDIQIMKFGSFSYNQEVYAPTSSQLNPVVNNSNPLFLTKGNPELMYSVNHAFTYNFSKYNEKLFFNGSLYFNYIINDIVSNISVNSNSGIQVVEPINVNGSKRLGCNFNITFPSLKIIRVNLGTNFSYRKALSYINDQASTAKNFKIACTQQISYSYKKYLDIDFNSATELNQNDYLGVNQNYNRYISQDLKLDFTGRLGDRYRLTSVTDNKLYFGQTAGFNRSILNLRSGLTYFALKNRNLSLKLDVSDILNRNSYQTRNFDPLYVESIKQNSIGRYYLFTVVYSYIRSNSK